MNIIQTLALLMALSLLNTGCAEHNKAGSQRSDESNQQIMATITDQWVGTWYGPEGTFLKLAGSDGKYKLTIQNLDGPRSFEGVSTGNQIQFERDGLKELIRATNGKNTGMKWLSEKSNCLTIRYGEGYCQD